MHDKQQFQNLISCTISRAATAALAIATVFALMVIMAQAAQAQTFTVLHDFSYGQDGGYPYAGLTIDRGGNLYGTTYAGGTGSGTVYKLTHTGSGWTFNPLYSFTGGSDGGNPNARVVFGPDGALYGTTYAGGQGSNTCPAGCGTVFNLRPSPKACKTALCPWTETVLYSFKGGADGALPYAEVVFDQAGNIYSTTRTGGVPNPISRCVIGECGVVFELTPSVGGWIESVIYSFSGSDGAKPLSRVILDQVGNLYGTTSEGTNGGCNGVGCGTVFQLKPSGSGWAENTLYTFQNGSDGAYPSAGLIFDQSGNLYGATQLGAGTVFNLTPSGGTWTYSLVYSFGARNNFCGPRGDLFMDGTGNLYGTTYCDGANGLGSVFKLTRSGGSWTYTSLHDFTGGRTDGVWPDSNVVIDAQGNLYGTASSGGFYGYGVVWEITP